MTVYAKAMKKKGRFAERGIQVGHPKCRCDGPKVVFCKVHRRYSVGKS